jgi:hypothetical protein
MSLIETASQFGNEFDYLSVEDCEIESLNSVAATARESTKGCVNFRCSDYRCTVFFENRPRCSGCDFDCPWTPFLAFSSSAGRTRGTIHSMYRHPRRLL